MGQLEKRLKQRNRTLQQKQSAGAELPLYGEGGTIKKKAKKSHNVIAVIILAVVALAAAIWVPSFFQKETAENPWIKEPDIAAVKELNEYAKLHTNEDTDQDGLSNAQELQYNTNVRRMDTDGDGVGDYAEIFINNTDPLKSDDTLYKLVKAADQKEGNLVNTPYQIEGRNVVLWADDMTSKTYGGVALTHRGYRFYNFHGWAEFPKGSYAYQIDHGIHKLLKYSAEENAWYIDQENEIVLTEDPLEMINKVTILNKWNFYVDDNIFGKVLNAILPDQGPVISCQHMAINDTWDDSTDYITAEIKKIEYDPDEVDLYGQNQNALTDLANVYAQIDKDIPILVVLTNQSVGSCIFEVYGYTGNGDLLIADPETLQPVGILRIYERASKFMGANGEIIQREWYRYSGAGFDSDHGDYIHFFAAYVDPEEYAKAKQIKTTMEALTKTVPEVIDAWVDQVPVFRWKKTDGAQGYVIYRKTDQNADAEWEELKRIPVADLAETDGAYAFRDETAVEGASYRYTVQAFATYNQTALTSQINTEGVAVEFVLPKPEPETEPPAEPGQEAPNGEEGV